jgi:TRAP-type mannitol/chloroaromatic compound transport system permease small subunit
LEWHLFAIIILFGVPYAFRLQAHVRVDFVYERLSLNTQNKIDIFGTLFFLFPFSILIISTSFSFVMDSYEILEISSDPGGLQYRWIVKAMIPASFVLLQIAAIEYIWNILSPENLDTTEDIVHHTGSWKESIK